MRKIFFLLMVILSLKDTLFAQTTAADAIKKKLEVLNNDVTGKPCDTKNGMIITNRALNVLFANKIAFYLAEGGDLSLYKNYATLNSSSGLLSINQNFGKGGPSENPMKSLTTVGVRANIADGFASIFSNQQFNNELGFTIKQTWFFKGTVQFDQCNQVTKPTYALTIINSQKQAMTIQLITILRHLETEISQKAHDFEQDLN